MTAPHGDDGSARAIVAAFLANLGIALAKFVAFAMTGAASMLAEGVHSVADTGNQGLLFLGGRPAPKPAPAQHPLPPRRGGDFLCFVVRRGPLPPLHPLALLQGGQERRL